MAAHAIAELLSVVVPPACVACHGPLPRADLRLCADCARALPWMPKRTCPRCALPSHRRACPAAGAAFGRAWAPLVYDGVARELVAALKFRGALPVATLMAAHVAANLPAELRAGPASLVPVPPQPTRARRRGFDAAGVLASELAPRLGLPERACLRRSDRERRQVGAGRSQRRRAGRLAIELRAPPPPRALLVDDVHTTGTTLDSCARALVAGGCREVVAVTYARTL